MRHRAYPILIPLVLGVLLLTGPRSATPRPPQDVDAEVEALIRADRVLDAIDLLRDHLARRPADRGAWVELAEIERRRCNLASARETYDRLLATNLLDPEAHAGHAMIHLLLGEPQAALESATLALATARGRQTVNAWRAHATALIDLGRYGPGLASAKRGVRIAPDDGRMLQTYARAAFRMGDMPAARVAYTRATRLDPLLEESNLRLGSGFGPRLEARFWRRPAYEAGFATGIAAWESGRPELATRIFRRLVDAEPESFKFRLGLGLARAAVRHATQFTYGGRADTAYALLPSPATPALTTYIVNWGALPDWAKRVIRTSVAPARAHLPEMLRYDATHEILALSTSLDEAPARRRLRAMQTFDGRWYAHIRGVGGLAAATGIEKLKSTATFGFNTFAHEFAHQLLRQGFPRRLRKRVEALYVKARNHNRCLDYYAASNVDEYFAQGYEALVSLRKRGCLRDTARHTRRELIERDPELFAFLLEVLDLSHETPAAMRAFEAAAPK